MDPGSNHCRTCRHCTSTTAGVLGSPSRLAVPQTHRHHVVGRQTLLDGITCCIVFAENGRRPWTACNTSDDVRFSAVTKITAAGPGRSTVSAQHHAAAARRLTGPYLCPCDESSTQGYKTWSWTPYAGVKSGPLVSSS